MSVQPRFPTLLRNRTPHARVKRQRGWRSLRGRLRSRVALHDCQDTSSALGWNSCPRYLSHSAPVKQQSPTRMGPPRPESRAWVVRSAVRAIGAPRAATLAVPEARVQHRGRQLRIAPSSAVLLARPRSLRVWGCRSSSLAASWRGATEQANKLVMPRSA